MALDFDIIAVELGKIGRAQVLMYLMICYYMFFAGFNSMATVFIAYLPEYRCDVTPLSDYVTNEDDILNYTTPLNSKGGYDRCQRYGYDLSTCTNLTCVDTSADPIKCDQGYYYDRSVMSETVITEFDLVCDDYNMIAVSTSIYQVGKLFGSLAFGNFADRFGRKITCIVTFLGALACNFGVGYSTSVYTYMIFRALTAALAYGTTIGTFVYVMEIIHVKYRTLFGIAYQIFFAIGYMIQSAIAYRWRNWHDVMLVCNIVASPFLLFAILLPESPRWLFTMNRTEEGKKVVRRIARFNGTKINEEVWQKAEISEKEKMEKEVEVKKTYSTLDLFKLPATRLVTINVMFSWFVNTLVYYGVGLNAGALAGDLFLNNTLNGVMEISSYIITVLLLDRLGRRNTLAGGFIVASIGLIVSLVMVELSDNNPSLEIVSVVFAFIGKIGISGSFAIIYNYTTELYPTVTRSNGIAMGSVAGRVGGILAPFIISLQIQVRWLPNAIFGGLGLLAAAATFAFPETNGCKMLETIDEAEYFYRTGKSREYEDSDSVDSGNPDEIEKGRQNKSYTNDKNQQQTKM